VLLLGACGLTTVPQDRKQQFAALYDRYVGTVRAMDAAANVAFFAADFAMTTPDGVVHDRAEMLRYLEVNARTTTKVHDYTVTLQAIEELDGGDVAAIVVQKYDRVQAPAEAPAEEHRVQTSVVQRETWRKTPAGWKIRTIEELLVGPTLIDGVVLQP
jgi:hypothetical protein